MVKNYYFLILFVVKYCSMCFIKVLNYFSFECFLFEIIFYSVFNKIRKLIWCIFYYILNWVNIFGLDRIFEIRWDFCFYNLLIFNLVIEYESGMLVFVIIVL